MSDLLTRSSANAVYYISDKGSLFAGNKNETLMVDEIFSIESYQFNPDCAAVTQFYLRPES